jgi:hypothetical protein
LRDTGIVEGERMNSFSDLRTWWKSVVRPDRITDAIVWFRHEIAEILDAGATGTVSVNAGASGWSWEAPAILVLGLVAGIVLALVFAALNRSE